MLQVAKQTDARVHPALVSKLQRRFLVGSAIVASEHSCVHGKNKVDSNMSLCHHMYVCAGTERELSWACGPSYGVACWAFSQQPWTRAGLDCSSAYRAQQESSSGSMAPQTGGLREQSCVGSSSQEGRKELQHGDAVRVRTVSNGEGLYFIIAVCRVILIRRSVWE
jgi:hypothetical protein